MTPVFVGVGANLGDPLAQCKEAVHRMATHPDFHSLRPSSYYRSKPMGPQDQPDYVNLVVHFFTELSPNALLLELQTIEAKMGKVKRRHWGERCIDLDILLYEQHQLDEPDCTIPHPGLTQRSFVVYPLLELEPDLILPDGTLLSSLSKGLYDPMLSIIEQESMHEYECL